MKFECPQCGQRLAAEADMAGRQIDCPACAQRITIPAEMPAAAAAASVPAAIVPAPPALPAAAAPVGTPAITARAKARSAVPRLAFAAAAAVAVLAVGGWFLFQKKSGFLAAAGAPNLLGMFKKGEVTEIKVFPSEINLKTKADRQGIVVQALYADGVTRDVTDDASFSLANRSLAKMDGATMTPLVDGRTELQVKCEGRSLTVPVTVESAPVETPLSFKLDVMPVFTKAGCNSGACHGASRGKDGFRLSLFGYDPDGDYARLTTEQIGRRLNLGLPEESLVVAKGLGAVQHTGGERFKKDSALCRTLVQWIGTGAPKDSTNVARVSGLEIMPTELVLDGEGAKHRLSVRAKYSDGTDRDVTSTAVFISNNDVSAKVSEDGMITAAQRGEAFVMARYDTFNVGAQVIVIPKNLKYEWPVEVAEYNYIDKAVHAKLKKLRFTPSALCDDATFIRRASLDIAGQLPTVEETRRFVEEPSAGKRESLVDELLGRKEFADLWVMKWSELLQIRSRNDQFSQKNAIQYYDWLRDRMMNNVPIDKIVHDLITASGSTLRNPAANYYQVQTDTLKTAENAAQVFMGMRIQCAQCHNHPFDRWTMNDYYSFAAFFPQVGRKPGEDPRETVVFDKGDGEIRHPVGNRTMKPKFLGGDAPEIPGSETRREALARWIASPDNPYFARNLANIVWAHFMGMGIIDPVDDVRISNPASNPELLEALGRKFTEYQYDFKKLVRDICLSRTYQLSTRANESNALDDRNFSHARIRRVRAEVLLDCISAVTETKDKFQGLPRGAHAVQIADGNVSSFFLTTFGRASRETVCSCEVKTEPNLSQALHLLNGNTVESKVNEGGLVKRMLKEGKKRDAIMEDLYLRALSRKPTPEEMTKLTAFFKEDKKEELVLNDLFWSLLNSKEFIFNH